MFVLLILFAIGFYIFIRHQVITKTPGQTAEQAKKAVRDEAVGTIVVSSYFFMFLGLPILWVIMTIALLPFPPFNFIVPFVTGTAYVRWRKRYYLLHPEARRKSKSKSQIESK